MSDRTHLIDELRKRGIAEEILQAIDHVDRDVFVPRPLQHRAYEDVALPIDCMQTISQPYTVAFMTQMLAIKPGMKVLEIGTGSGYQAAVLCEMGARVFTIERHAALLLGARQRLEALQYNVASKVGDGSVGWSEFAPYDRIIVTAAAPKIPDALFNQLADGGLLLVPVGDADRQKLTLVQKVGTERIITEWEDFKFVPLVGKEGWEARGKK